MNNLFVCILIQSNEAQLSQNKETVKEREKDKEIRHEKLCSNVGNEK